MISSNDQLRQALSDCLAYVSQGPARVLTGLVTAVQRVDTPNGHHIDVTLWDGAKSMTYSFADKSDAGQGGSAADPASLPILQSLVTLHATPPSGSVELWLLSGWTEG